MTLRATHTPLPLDQLLDLYEADGRMKPLEVSAAILQGARSDGVGFYDAAHDGRGGRLVAAGLLYPLNDTTYELVFACRAEARRHIVQIVKQARLTADLLPDAVTVRARCRRDNVAGRRLAWLCGFRPAGITGAFKRYELTNGKICRRREVAVLRGRHLRAGSGQQATA